ncbi:MAG: LCP family protein [Patescibacteria group bacterium]
MAKHYYSNEIPDVDDQNEAQVEAKKHHTPKRHSRRSSKWLILLLSFGFFVFSTFLYVQASASPLSQGLRTLPWLSSITRFINPLDNELVGEELDIINIVVVGIGGEGHDGGYLADTIILARFKPSTSQVGLVSIPRDFAVNLPQYGWRKINNAHAYGGAELLADMISDVIDEPVPYYVVIDFNGFEELVDDLGGVDVYVERSFTDLEFPDANYQFQTVSFEQGLQHMNGDQALKFVRSRHGDNGEGSDFARSARQQKIIFAIKDKVLSTNTLLNPTKLITLYNTFTKYVDTNIESSEIIRIAQLAQNINEQSIEKTVLADGPTGLLEATIHDSGAYLLIPKAGIGNYTDIRAHINTLFEQEELSTETAEIEETVDPLPVTPEPEVVVEEYENPKVIVLNGTTLPGYAGTVAALLQTKNFEVLDVANNNDQTFETTRVYDLTSSSMNASTKILSSLISFEAETNVPEDFAEYVRVLTSTATYKDTDYIVILGLDNRSLIE